MDSKEFTYFRKKLNKTQGQMAQLLGISIKAVQSYEQGWRPIAVHAERQMFFLISRKRSNRKPCWKIKKCPVDIKKQCPAWEFRTGDICWIINGTMCCSGACKEWTEKIKCCKSCEVLAPLLLWSLNIWNPRKRHDSETKSSSPNCTIRLQNTIFPALKFWTTDVVPNFSTTVL